MPAPDASLTNKPERILQIRFPFCAGVEMGLCLGITQADHRPGDANSRSPGQSSRKDFRLIETARHLPESMQGNRNKTIDLTEKALGRLLFDQSIRQSLGDGPLAVILGGINQVSQRISKRRQGDDAIEGGNALPFAIRTGPSRPAKRLGAAFAGGPPLEMIQFSRAGWA